MAGGLAWRGGGMRGREGACMVGKTTVSAGGTHPTGMHSCIIHCVKVRSLRN